MAPRMVRLVLGGLAAAGLVLGPVAVPAAQATTVPAASMSRCDADNPPRLVEWTSRHNCVSLAQFYLNHGPTDPHLVNDGVFGPATLRAVRSMQGYCGLQRDGVVGPKTWEMLAVNLYFPGVAC